MKKLVFVLIILALNFCAFSQKKISGKVIGISDGDTFSILTADNKTQKIRLAHIDCPEKKQAFGNAAKKALSDLIYLQNVDVSYFSSDRNGRIIGEVFFQKKFINLFMIEKGFAWHFKKYSKDIRFSNAEIVARKNKIGLWSVKNPIEPWVFRKIK